MQKTEFKKLLSLILCIVLTAAMALFTTGCQDLNEIKEETSVADNSVTEEAEIEEIASTAAQELGDGETSFILTVTNTVGTESVYKIYTNKTTVGEALSQLGLIEGEEGPYGLYIKTVNGETVDYGTDGKYWAFYINGEYASTSADQTAIEEGAAYSFKVE